MCDNGFSIERVIEVLTSGAKSSTICRTLREEGYCLTTFGWDSITNGVYHNYKDDYERELGISDMSDWDHIESDFVYKSAIFISDIAALKASAIRISK